MIAAASLALFLSGSAGLVFEIVWFYRAGFVFGSGVVAAAVVLSSFMAGLAIGNATAGWIGVRIRGLFRVYALLEIIIAVTGVALTYILSELEPHHVPLVTAFVLLLVPASAMGATLPVLVAACRSRGLASFGWTLGTLYGWNTAGAVCGAVIAQSVLVAAFGLTGSAWTAAALDTAAAVIAVVWAGRGEHSAIIAGGPEGPHDIPSLPVAACAAGAGLTLLALEVIWFRFLSTFVLTTTLVMSAMLAVVLGGIALGGFAAAQWLRRVHAPEATAAVAFAAAVSVAGTYAGFAVVTAGTQVGSMAQVVWFAVVLTLPTSCLSGALFTLFGAAMRRAMDDDGRAAAALTCANTIGAACGAPLAAFVLLPGLGTEGALHAAAVGYTFIALAAWRFARPVGRGPLTATALTAFAAFVALIRFPIGLMDGTYAARIASAYSDDGSRIVASREGPVESILLMQQRWMDRPVYSRLVTNGFSMSGTAIPGQRYMKYFVYWPMLMHAAPLQRILVICYGVGVTAGAALDVPSASSVDVVEISRDVAAMSDVIYAGDRNPLRDPRVTLHIDDGRHFLQTTGDRFDLITGEPPPPRTPGAVNIYTREYFELIRDRLNDGGMTTYWLPVGRPNPGTDVNTIVRAFCGVFADCSLWNATPFDLMLAGSRSGGRARFDADRFAAVHQQLSEIGFEAPEQIGATFLGDAAFLNALAKDTPPLTDDFPERLRPAADRVSLSDPRYPSDAAAFAQYQSVLDTTRARAAFERSDYVKTLWPPELLTATLPRFDEQAMINRVLWEGGKPLRLIDDLDRVLTQTTLRTLPLWILGTDAVKQRIAASGNDGTGTVEYLRGAQLLADRDYESAASYFGLAERRGLRAPALRPLIAYALCKAGRKEMSAAIVAALPLRDDDDRKFAGWMRMNCGQP